MQGTGFEPAQALSYWSLNPARLTTPASLHENLKSSGYKKLISKYKNTLKEENQRN
jgi:hypothetical protein